MDLLIPSFGLIIWTLLAFLIVFFILKKFAWKPILKSLTERETMPLPIHSQLLKG